MKLGIRVPIWVVVFFSGFSFQCRFEEVDPLYADFQVIEGSQAMLPVIFKEKSEGATTWAWTFGNGHFFDGQNPPPQVFSEEGKYTISLTVQNTQGNEDTKSIEIVIGPPPAVLAQFSMPPYVRVSDTVSFVNSSLFGTSFLWDFGPSTIQSIEVNPKQSFSVVGSRVIKLVAANSKGIDSMEQRLEVCDVPVSAFTTPGNSGIFSSNVGISFNSEISLLNATDSLVSFYWDFGDGSSSSERNPTYQYLQPGDYQVRLRVSNPCGEHWSAAVPLKIIGPTACFSVTNSGCIAPCSIYFSNCSTSALSFEWDFGDGTTSNLIVPAEKIYSLPGDYQVKLTAFNGVASDYTTMDIIISDGPVECEARIGPGVSDMKQFMCYNLGAANTSVDPFEPSWMINGGYWQWGRPLMTAPGPASSNLPNAGIFPGSNPTPADDNSWSDLFKTPNDPCPSGYRVPTSSEWIGMAFNNSWVDIGTWESSPTNYGSGKKVGDKLFLPAAGLRLSNGILFGRGELGAYWSSTHGIPTEASQIFFTKVELVNQSYFRNHGLSVRCIKE
jgi:PKD repeat protein